MGGLFTARDRGPLDKQSTDVREVEVSSFLTVSAGGCGFTFPDAW